MTALDFGARATAARLATRMSANERAGRLHRLAMAAKGANASDWGALASPPGLSCTGNAAGPGLSQIFTAANNPSLFTLYGGVPARDSSGALYGGYWRGHSVTLPSGGNAGVGTGAQGVVMRVAFRSDAPAIDIIMLGQAATSRIRVLIDGRYADKTGVSTATTSGGNTLSLVWPAGTSRTMRRYDVEYEKDGGFFGVRVAPGDMVQPIATGARYRIAVLGDSVAAGIGATHAADGFAFHAGRRLGNMDLDMVAMGIGGTGFCNAGAAAAFPDRLDDLLLQPVDEVWIAGGANDQAFSADQATAAALACLKGVRARCPDAPILLLGSFVGGGDNAAARVTETAIRAGFYQFADPLAAFIPFNLAIPPLQTGNFQNPAAGNYQFYGQGTSDTTHPSDAGHDYIGAYIAEARRSITL